MKNIKKFSANEKFMTLNDISIALSLCVKYLKMYAINLQLDR